MAQIKEVHALHRGTPSSIPSTTWSPEHCCMWPQHHKKLLITACMCEYSWFSGNNDPEMALELQFSKYDVENPGFPEIGMIEELTQRHCLAFFHFSFSHEIEWRLPLHIWCKKIECKSRAVSSTRHEQFIKMWYCHTLLTKLFLFLKCNYLLFKKSLRGPEMWC